MLKRIYFSTEDQIELVGLLETPEKPTNKVVISIHGMQSNCLKQREYDGSHLTFEGMNPSIELRSHQKDAVARVLYGGNTLLAHEVRSWKNI